MHYFVFLPFKLKNGTEVHVPYKFKCYPRNLSFKCLVVNANVVNNKPENFFLRKFFNSWLILKPQYNWELCQLEGHDSAWWRQISGLKSQTSASSTHSTCSIWSLKRACQYSNRVISWSKLVDCCSLNASFPWDLQIRPRWLLMLAARLGQWVDRRHTCANSASISN